jgi:hypothetical protein
MGQNMTRRSEVCQKSDTQSKQKPKRDWKAVNARRNAVKVVEMVGGCENMSRDTFWKFRHIMRIIKSGMIPKEIADDIHHKIKTYERGKSKPMMSFHAAYKICRWWEYRFIVENLL